MMNKVIDNNSSRFVKNKVVLEVAIKKNFDGNVVLASRLVPLHPNDGWKWICHLPLLQ